MIRLLKAFRYKLFRDLTFRITCIIGVGLSLLMTLLYFMIEKMGQSGVDFGICTGQTMLVMAVNPAQGFGYSIPINLCTFIVLEFTSGTIRNKIIAGNSKFKIYASLFISGLVFAILLIGLYIALCFGFGSAFGGFDPNGMIFGSSGNGIIYGHFILKLILVTAVCYVTITSLSIFVSTLFRNIGPCIPVVIVTFMVFGIFPMIMATIPGTEELMKISSFLNPFHYLVTYDMTPIMNGEETTGIFNITLNAESIIKSVIVNLVYSAGFFALGSYLFVKKDVK